MSDQDQTRVLVVDDEDAIRNGLVSALRRANFEVVEARDGVDALAKVEKHRPDIIVLDILMPVMDGREVCRRLRQDEDWTPVIMLTSDHETDTVKRTLALGADGYVVKPVSTTTLVARVKETLSGAGVAVA